MFNLTSLLKKASHSSNYLKLLNYGLARKIPFNKPHGFRILEVGDEHITMFLPFKKTNKNHLGGVHAMALGTLSEYTTGLALLRQLDAKRYRLIMKSIRMEYYYQGKTAITASFRFSAEDAKLKIMAPLENNDSTIVMCDISCYDAGNNHISTGYIEWQIKDWKKVRTKVK